MKIIAPEGRSCRVCIRRAAVIRNAVVIRNAAVICALLAAGTGRANTGTVAAELSADGTAFNVTFANHANETNVLWVVYGASDKGGGTNGWDVIERLGSVSPETDAWSYTAPGGWGDTVKAIRFLLSNDPWDDKYDYRLDFIRSSAKERIILDDFDLYLNYCVCAQMLIYSRQSSGNPAFFSNRGEVSSTPYFVLFAFGGTEWRFDYNQNNNAKRVAGIETDALYDIAASSAGLFVNGEHLENAMAAAATASEAKSNGRLEFFCGSTTAKTLSNHTAHMNLYGAQIYDAPTGGDLLVNLVPMVKDGRAGLYDTVRNVYYHSDTGTDFDLAYGPSRVDPFFTSALCKVASDGPTVFSPATAMTDATDHANAAGGVLDGTATLALSGKNDWGGVFTVSNGTLVAGFGQGLAATDNLLLSHYALLAGAFGGYGGWNGKATAALGTGAGQIAVPSGGYLGYCAADGGTLEVDIGGEGAAWTPTADVCRLILNGAVGAGALTFKNPITLSSAFDTIVRIGYGTVTFTGNIASETIDADGGSLSVYDLGTTAADGVARLQGGANRLKTYYQNGGTYVLDEGSSTEIGGVLQVDKGTFLATNAMVKLTGAAGTGGWIRSYGGEMSFLGGTVSGGGFLVGEDKEQSATESLRPSLTLGGKMSLAGLTATSSSGTSYGSGTIRKSAASTALTILDGADVEIYNLVFHRRNIYQRGGLLWLKGNNGLCQMGHDGGTARYHLLKGAELRAPRVVADTGDSIAQFLFRGGKLSTSTSVHEVFFQNFGANACLCVVSSDGGEFCAEKSTSITNGIVEVPEKILKGYSAWNYAPAAYLTAPAFVKSGAATLTLAGASTYNCATEVAAGTLALASGDTPGVLPEGGVVRLTGGTLNLGGNAQTVKALVGTAGSVANGTLRTTEGVYPGGAGTVGAFTCGAALAGTLYIDAADDGTCDRLIADGTLALDGLALVLPDVPEGVTALTVVSGATSGTFASVSGLPAGWELHQSGAGVTARKATGLTVVIR